jgi:nucleotide-binding universal stress UspA family protein
MSALFGHLVITLDGSEYAERALAYGAELAVLAGAHVSLLTVVAKAGEPLAPRDPERDERRREYWLRYLSGRAEELRAAGAADVSVHAPFGHAARTISDFARQSGADLVVMSTQGLGADEHHGLGSVALKGLMSAPCPVLLVRVAQPPPPRNAAEERWQEEGGANVG